MPVIPVDTKGNWHTTPNVISVMLFPDDEQNHAICMAENRHKKQHLEEMASSILRGMSTTKEPMDSLIELPALTDEEYDDFLLPKVYRIDDWEPPTTLKEQLAQEEREGDFRRRMEAFDVEKANDE